MSSLMPSLASSPSLHRCVTTNSPHRKRATTSCEHFWAQNRPAAREATESRHHGLHLLRNIWRESSAVRSSSPPAKSVPVRPRSVVPWHQSNSEVGRTAFRVARRTERLPNLGTDLPDLSEVSRLTVAAVGDCTLPAGRFIHVHIDLVGPLPTSTGYTYCLTTVDSFTRWPEGIPIPDITFDTVVRAYYHHRPGRQFEWQPFHFLAKLCGIQLSRKTADHPAANGLVERFHRTLKAAIMCHADQQWTETLPLVLLGLCMAFKTDLQASVVELVYGEPLRIPGKLLTSTTDPMEPAHIITQLRQHMARLRPVPAARHASPTTFVHKDLHNCTHVFSRQDALRRDLEPPYSDPYQVLSRRQKTMKPLVRGKPVTVSADKLLTQLWINSLFANITASGHLLIVHEVCWSNLFTPVHVCWTLVFKFPFRLKLASSMCFCFRVGHSSTSLMIKASWWCSFSLQQLLAELYSTLTIQWLL
jgi:hypothetical protein